MGGFYVLRGYSKSVIQYDEKEELWKISLLTVNTTYATTNVTDYPFGKQQWTIYNDPCFGPGEVTTTLDLNACNVTEYNCVSGQCIPMSQRCDGILNCRDKTGNMLYDSISSI